jgi:iron complex transport system ATP-binding protein
MILDEPTAFLDISNKYEIVRILHNLAQDQEKCIIYSTHDLNTALLMADRIWLLLDNKVVEGMPEELAALGCFEALFPHNPHLFFDAEKGDYRIRRETKGTVYLSGSRKEQEIATKALERIGFCVKEFASEQQLINTAGMNESDSIVVSKVDGLWNLTTKQGNFKFETLEQLIRALKKVIPLPVS